MDERIAGFDWDDANRGKCTKHGVSPAEIEALFATSVSIRPDRAHSRAEEQFLAVGKGNAGREIFLVFTLRHRGGRTYIRPISARHMHRKEVARYEKENPSL